MFRAPWLLLLAALAPLAHGSLDDAPLIRAWQTENGLPSNTVNAIAQTPDGFLWIGTNSGLVRFDGAQFVTYGLHSGLPSQDVVALLAQRDGTLWIGCQTGGLARMRKGVITVFTVKDGLPSDSVFALAEDQEGRIWTGGRKGVAFESGEKFLALPNPPRINQGVGTLQMRRSGDLWACFLAGEVRVWHGGAWVEPSPPPGSRFGIISCLAQDAAGSMWLASANSPRILKLGAGGWQIFPIRDASPGGYPRPFSFGPDGTVSICMGLHGAGLCQLRGGEFVPVQLGEGMGESQIRASFTDMDGQLWLGTLSSGLWRLTHRRIENCRLDPTGNADRVDSLLEVEPGVLWVGIEGAGLWRWAAGRADRPVTNLDIALNGYVKAMLRSRDGSVWLAGLDAAHGLYQFRDGKLAAIVRLSLSPSDSIWALAEDAEGTLWAGCNSGRLFRVRNGGAEAFEPGYNAHSIMALAITPDRSLWVATLAGLRRIRGAGTTDTTDYTTTNGLQTDEVLALHVDNAGTLWVGTSGGLACWRDGRFMAVGSGTGLPEGRVTQILDDGAGQLWLGGARGLTAVDKHELEAVLSGSAGTVHPRVFGRSDGMASPDRRVTPIRMADGHLCFGTVQGFALVDPHPPARRTVSTCILNELLVNGESRINASGAPFPEAITLGPGPVRIDIGFTAPDLVSPEEMSFRYRLLGLESEWHDIPSQRTVNFSGLPPGNYRFEVTDSFKSGWSASPAALTLHLLPHFWQTAWFYAGCALAAMLTVAGTVHQAGRRRLAREVAVLDRRHAMDLERARIARDLHDDIGGSLTEMAMLSELTQASLADPDRSRSHLDQIFNSARSSARALDEIVWATDPAHDRLSVFVEYFTASAQTFAEAAGLRCRLELCDTLPDITLSGPVRHHIYLSLKEALHNAAKHAGAQEVQIRVAVEGGALCVWVEDDGRGFDPVEACAAGSDGLANMKRRMTEIGGAFAIRSTPGGGTKVELTVPLERLGG